MPWLKGNDWKPLRIARILYFEERVNSLAISPTPKNNENTYLSSRYGQAKKVLPIEKYLPAVYINGVGFQAIFFVLSPALKNTHRNANFDRWGMAQNGHRPYVLEK